MTSSDAPKQVAVECHARLVASLPAAYHARCNAPYHTVTDVDEHPVTVSLDEEHSQSTVYAAHEVKVDVVRPAGRRSTQMWFCCRADDGCAGYLSSTKSKLKQHVAYAHAKLVWRCGGVNCSATFDTEQGCSRHQRHCWNQHFDEVNVEAAADLDEDTDEEDAEVERVADTLKELEAAVEWSDLLEPESPPTSPTPCSTADTIRRSATRSYHLPRMRIETMELLMVCDKLPTSEYPVWVPDACPAGSSNNTSSTCSIKRDGYGRRWCLDVCEGLWLRVPQYKCKTHATATNHSNGFNAFDVVLQGKVPNNVVKSFDAYTFGDVTITASLHYFIAAQALVDLNLTHCAQIICHMYRRFTEFKKLKRAALQYTSDDPRDRDCKGQMYGLAGEVADKPQKLQKVMKYADEAAWNPIGRNTVRKIFHQDIMPRAVLPLASALQELIITKHSKSAIAFDHSFKLAKFGAYAKNSPHPLSSADPAEVVAAIEANPNTNPNTNPNKRKLSRIPVEDDPSPPTANTTCDSGGQTAAASVSPSDDASSSGDVLVYSQPTANPNTNPNKRRQKKKGADRTPNFAPASQTSELTLAKEEKIASGDADAVPVNDGCSSSSSCVAQLGLRPEKHPTSTNADPATMANRKKRQYIKKVGYFRAIAQILTCTDSAGLVLAALFVPNGRSDFPHLLLQDIIARQRVSGKSEPVSVVSTDNAVRDAPGLMRAFEAATGKRLLCCQDIWHAVQRVKKEIRKGHPDAVAAAAEISAIFKKLTDCKYESKEKFVDALEGYIKTYTVDTPRSELGEMDQIVAAAQNIATPDERARIDTSKLEQWYTDREYEQELRVAAAKRKLPAYTALRHGGETSLREMVKHVDYLWNRTHDDAKTTVGTTPNEALHHTFNGRLPRFGGVRTFETAMQIAALMVYQYNHQKLSKQVSDQYWVPIMPLPLNACNMPLLPVMPKDCSAVVQKAQFAFQRRSRPWSDNEFSALKTSVISLATATERCHTRDVYYWLSTQPQLSERSTEEVKYKVQTLRSAAVATASSQAPVEPKTSDDAAKLA